MVKLCNYFITFVFSVLVISCTIREIPTDNHVRLTVSENQGSIFDMFSNRNWIQLSDTITDAFVPYPTRIISAGDKFYILDLFVGKDVKVFALSGEYLHAIGKLGNGPGEYNNIVDFTVNDKSGEIVILSEPSIANVYDLSGNFIKSKRLDDAALHHIVHTDGGYVATSDHATYPDGKKACLIYVFDNDLNLKSKNISINQYMSQMPVSSCALKSIGNKALYLDIFNARLYSCDCNSGSVECLLTFELPNMMPVNYLADNNSFYEHQREFDWILDFMADDKNMLIIYIASGKAYFSYLDYNGNIIETGLCKGWIPKAFNTIGDNFVIPISPEQYFNFLQPDLSSRDFKPDPEGNSILVNCRLKQI